MKRFRLGVDIGGTFTDATLMDETSGELHIAKVLSTPSDPSIGFMNAIGRILSTNSIDPQLIRVIVHATTVATNAIIEGKIARAGLITTQGFRDILEIGRQMRPSLYDVHFVKPPPLIPRHLSFGVPERLDAYGNVLTPLDVDAVRTVASTLQREEVESIAVCLLHSYVNPSHERAVAEALEETFPQAVVSLSSEVAPEMREYLRTSTTVINATIRPVVSDYLEGIESRLREAGIIGELLVMQSSGGVYSAKAARSSPVFMVESGPAAGVIAASYLGDAIGLKDMLSFDMGGTTAKTGLIVDGTPHVTKEYEVGAAAMAGVGRHRGAGYPILTPVIDLAEIGAGGGSIAWVDSGGALRVGPQSAGADPGPACYRRGGYRPTVTDANLVLGRLNPSYFLGGEMELDIDAAQAAIMDQCAEPLGLSLLEAANGIVEIANAAMVNALRLISILRGYDARDFALVAFGGAGPMHANRLATEMGIATIVVPVRPGVFSSLGLLVTDITRDYSTAFLSRADALVLAELETAFGDLEQRGEADLGREGLEPRDISFARFVDMRYVGQSFELTIPVPAHGFAAADLETILQAFNQEHDRAYGFNAPEEPVEFVAARVTAVGHVEKPRLHELVARTQTPAAEPKEMRRVAFTELGEYSNVKVFDRYELPPGASLDGPAIIEEVESSTVIHPGYTVRVDAFGNLWIEEGDGSRAQRSKVA